MSWQSYLRGRTRDPRFLWVTVLAILAAGAVVAVGVDVFVERPDQRLVPAAIAEAIDPKTTAPESDRTDVSRLQEAVEAHDWWRVWWLIPAASWGKIDIGPTTIAALTGLFWLLFLLQTGLALAIRHVRFWLCLAAIVLGALSTWPTLFLVAWQEEVWGFDLESVDDLMTGLKYFTLGVGVREELMKLLLLLPLLPWLIARRNELERLIVASCVGLGFAVEENVGYFGGSGSTISIGRYLTANFWHLASTGLAGLWLCRATRWPKDCGPQFVAYLGLIVLGHGVYDVLLMAGDYAIISSIVFLGLAYAYFREIRELRPPQREAISLTANFAVGLSLLAAITLVYVTAQVGLRVTNQIFLQPAVATSLMAYVFLREVPESLVRT